MSRFETSDINQASFLAASGFTISIHYSTEVGKAVFDFQEDQQLLNAIISYERGAVTPAKALLLTRTRLYHEASRVSGRGRA